MRQEQDVEEEDGRRWARYLRKVRAEEKAKADQRQLEDEAIRAMSPAEYDAFKKNVPDPGLAPKLPPRYLMALQDIATEDAKARNREREAREQRAGLPAAELAHTAKLEAIHQERAAAEASADEIKRAARDRARAQEDALGPAPTLESLEGVPA